MDIAQMHNKKYMLDAWAQGSDNGCSTTALRLNGKWYEFVEDPDDGYRSMLGSVSVVKKPCGNIATFPAVTVVAREPDDTYTSGIEFVEDGTVIATIGTDYSADYYPCVVMHMDIGKLSFNRNKE